MSEETGVARGEVARAWLGTHAGALPLDAGAARVEPVLNWGGFVNASFSVVAGSRRWHLKLATPDDSAGLRTWSAVHARLTARYRAPALVLAAAEPASGAWGALFDHVPGRPPRGLAPSTLQDVLGVLEALHADRELARALAEAGAPGAPETSCLDHYLENHDDRFRADLASIPRDLPLLEAGDHDWMWSEVETLAEHARRATAFQVRTRAPVHGDLWADNLLVADDGSWHVLDWDDLRIGDPVVDFATLLGPAPHDLRGAPLASLEGLQTLDGAAREWMRAYARATLLDWVIDPLADWVEADAAGAEAPRVRAEKERLHREAKALYRARWG